MLENVEIYQEFYMNINDYCVNSFKNISEPLHQHLRFCVNSLKEYILSSPWYILESIIREMRLDWTDREDFGTPLSCKFSKYFDVHYLQNVTLTGITSQLQNF